MGGLVTMPGIAYYHASKFALEGLFESPRKEVASFGIHVTWVEAGGFRTDWAGRSMVRSARRISDYDPVMEPTHAHRRARDGSQVGDPSKAALAMLAILDSRGPPAHLLPGSDALALVEAKLARQRAEIARWRALTCSTDVEPCTIPR